MIRRWAVVLVMVLATAASPGCGKQTAPAAAPFRPLAIGEPTPSYDAVTLTGDTVHFGVAGPLTLLNVWATWCESCREEMADLDTLERDFSAHGLRIVAVSVDEGDGTRVRRYADALHLSFPIAHDPDGLIQQRYNTVGVPESYLIGRDGRLLWRQAGGLHGNTAAARQAVERALPP